ncbi:uncharacterized protein LOC120793286 [Xiphias gladius]|uniref:uncharacterized protein LOC120793286 n=1 Tax=Xiphias gladius TaxID=8245 RepID=UPI001A996422|nr:uncharacterized protein LOC120793286 [Xiphias gladius]
MVGLSELFSPKKSPDPCDEDGSTDIDDQCPGTSLVKRPSQKKKRGKRTKAMGAMVGRSELFSPKKSPDPCGEDGSTDIDDQCPGTSLVKRPSQKKKRGKRTKAMGAMVGRSELFSPKKSPDPCGEDGSTDIDDQCPGTSLVKRPSQKKKRGKRTKAMGVMERTIVKAKRPWSEVERSAVKKHLAKFIKERQVPGKEPCMQCVKEEKALDKRSWKDVKNFVFKTIVSLSHRSASKQLYH